jgi:pyoverdine/dityrosine biosynthesis protein Dit1
MRNFAYKNPDFVKNEVVPELVENNPCYQPSVYDSVMYDETLDGDLIQSDMTQILLNQEKYRRLLGDMNVQNILAQMHPTQSTFMDDMTDEQRFDCVISRHCQTMSERQAVLQQLANEKSELSAYAESMLAENTAVSSTDFASASES